MSDNTDKILGEILNNTTNRLKYDGKDYLILIKKQEGKDFCTLFFTDCCDNIWVQKIDLPFCEKLKKQMNVKSSTENFARHFSSAIRRSCTIQEMDPNPILKMKLLISEGLIINCTLTLAICKNCEEDVDEYKKLLKIFFLQLYEAKEQISKKIQLESNKDKNDEPQSLKKQKAQVFMKAVLSIPEKKQAPQLAPKNRDLINPLKKRRKQQGIKLTGGE